MSVNLKALFHELKSIEAEIKSLNTRRLALTKRRLKVKEELTTILEKNDHPGLKENGTALYLKKTEVREKKKPNEVIADTKKVLESYGIKESDKALIDILEAKKGKSIPTTKLEIKKIKPKK